MVSGLVTSPCDQLRIFSGEARLMRIASKSAIGFPSSNGFDRNKLSSCPAVPFCGMQDPAAFARPLAAPVCIGPSGAASCGSSGGSYLDPQRSVGGEGSGCNQGLVLVGLDQFHIQAERLQLANEHVERLGHTRLDGRFALDDGLVNLGAAIHVVGL